MTADVGKPGVIIDPKCLGRLLARVEVDPETGCWGAAGRGLKRRLSVTPLGKSRIAYRFVYESLVGPIPPGLVIHHLCGNPGCINPLHLEPITVEENARRGIRVPYRKPRERCIRGHLLSGKNLYLRRNERGTIIRTCRTCAAARMRGYRKKKKRLARARARRLTARESGHEAAG